MDKQNYRIVIEVGYMDEIVIPDLDVIDFMAIIPIFSKTKLMSNGREKEVKIVIEKEHDDVEVIN